MGAIRVWRRRRGDAGVSAVELAVIAPDANVKLFVTASPEVRAQRRLKELEGRGMSAHFDDVLADIHARDQRDSSRAAAPLHPAADAILLDTSELDAEQSIIEAIRLAEERLEDR